MHVTTQRLDASRRDDFYRLHADANGAGSCFCVAWWVPTWDGWSERTAAANRRLREELFDRGEDDGYLLYVEGAPVGWCQVGPRDRLEKLARQYHLAPDPEAWAVSCFQIAPAHRRRGLARRLLADVIADLRARGVRRLEAFPKRVADDAGDLWNGPEKLYLDAGFRVVAEASRGAVLVLSL